MEPRHYIEMFRRWFWLLGLGLVVGILGGFLISRFQTPIYRASTKVLITQAGSGNNVSGGLVSANQQLADTYSQLLLTRPVLEGTSERLGYRVRSNQAMVQRVTNAEIVLLTVDDTNPERAADIANTLVEVFIEQNAALQAGRYSESEESLTAQIQEVQNTINTLEQELTNISEEGFQQQAQAVTQIIANLQTEMDTLRNDITELNFNLPLIPTRDPVTWRIIEVTATPAIEQRKELAAKQARLEELGRLLAMYQDIYVNLTSAGDPTQSESVRSDRIRAALNLYQQIHSNLLSNLEAIRLAKLQNTPNVLQVEAATPPPIPIRPQPLLNMAFGAILGLLLSGGAAVLIETMNSTVRDPEQISDLLQLPVLGYISEMDTNKKDDPAVPYVLQHPRSPVTEAFRSLRTNLQFVELDKPLRTLLVSSQGTAEGKTTIAVNLAVVIAQTGKRVILVDADLRRPRVHHELGLPNRVGLSNILRERVEPEKVFQRYKSDHLHVITSGGLPPNPAEVLSSVRMQEVMAELASIADIVIMDGPPLVFADSVALAATSDGVLMIVRPNHTQAGAAVAVVEQLHRVGAHPIGIVLNMIKQSEVNYYGHYKTYARYSVRGNDGTTEIDDTQPVKVKPQKEKSR